jgi:orotate phosphoribosyltransferase
MGLFQRGDFTLHSGDKSSFKIDCDYLGYDDIEALAELIASKFYFTYVYGVPRGGLRLAEALQKYCEEEYTSHLLIVDDVLTTGASMEDFKNKILATCEPNCVQGIVIFDRSTYAVRPAWITPIFRMW